MQEERSNGRILLGSPQSLYVETVMIKTDIKISVKEPVEGWTVGDIKPEVTSTTVHFLYYSTFVIFLILV